MNPTFTSKYNTATSASSLYYLSQMFLNLLLRTLSLFFCNRYSIAIMYRSSVWRPLNVLFFLVFDCTEILVMVKTVLKVERLMKPPHTPSWWRRYRSRLNQVEVLRNRDWLELKAPHPDQTGIILLILNHMDVPQVPGTIPQWPSPCHMWVSVEMRLLKASVVHKLWCNLCHVVITDW